MHRISLPKFSQLYLWLELFVVGFGTILMGNTSPIIISFSVGVTVILIISGCYFRLFRYCTRYELECIARGEEQ